ncbi:hypothetical protein [Sulfurospirillum sp. UCH001]|uniref:hypothetical protein n=1 Tax=Sulfurospirillum sp. UCH001 TaxID=1581011 RepID=UPI000B2171FC|nr:hypothetical protein [Sulfurospirillum sp. UCH001]
MKRRIKSKIKKRDIYILLHHNLKQMLRMQRLIEFTFILPNKSDFTIKEKR